MKRMIALLLAGLMLLCGGCAVSGSAEQGIQFYYAVNATQNTGSSLIGEWDDAVEPTVPDVMARLFSGPRQEVSRQTFPTGTTLLSWSLEEGELKLDLSESLSRLSGIAMTQAIYCIVLTVTQLEGVETASITVNGRALPGVATEGLSASDVVLKGETEDPVTIGVQLYFPLEDDSGLGVEYREFEVSDESVRAKATGVIKQLALGPEADSMTHFLSQPGVMEVLSVEGGVCRLELDNQSLSCLWTENELLALSLYALVDSLAELEGIDTVVLTVGGEALPGEEAGFTAVYEFS